MKSKTILHIEIALIFWFTFLAACADQPPTASISALSTDKIVISKILEEDNYEIAELIQTKTFNQCDSSGSFKVQVQFSDSSSKTAQKSLILKGGGSANVQIPEVVQLEIQGAIEEHFSAISSSGLGHQESVGIEVPAHTQQEYTITWKETRQTGVVTYLENGELKNANYSYRIGVDFVSSNVKDIPCSGHGLDSSAPIIDLIDLPSSIICDGRRYDIPIHFHDPDGDAHRIQWELIYSKKKTPLYSDAVEFFIDSQEQINGAIYPDFVQWYIPGDEVKIRVHIEDRAKQTGFMDFEFICSN